MAAKSRNPQLRVVCSLLPTRPRLTPAPSGPAAARGTSACHPKLDMGGDKGGVLDGVDDWCVEQNPTTGDVR